MIYLFYGEDNYTKEREVNKIKKDFGEMVDGINYLKISDTTINELIPSIETPAFGYPKKLIIAKNTNLFKKSKKSDDEENESSSKDTKELISFFEKFKPSDDVELIFVEDSVNKNKLYKTLEKIAEIKEFSLKKDSEVAKELIKIASMYKVKLDSTNSSYIVSNCGTDMQNLLNEIRKLIEYVGTGGTITKESIDKLVIRKPEAVVFDLTDYLGTKNVKAAINCYRDLLSQNVADQIIIVMIYRHIRNLYIYKLSKPEDVVKNLNLKPNQTFLPKIYARQAKLFSIEELKQILYELIYIDESSKNGNLDSISTGIESIMCRYF